MTEDKIERILAALDEAFRPMGYNRFDEGIGRVAGWFRQIADMTALMQGRDAFSSWLREIPDPEPAELTQALQLLPTLVYAIRQHAAPVGKSLPPPTRRRSFCDDTGTAPEDSRRDKALIR